MTGVEPPARSGSYRAAVRAGAPWEQQESQPHPAKGGEDRAEAASPYDTAGWVARMTFSYVRNLLLLGSRQPLQSVDLPSLARHDRGERVVGILEYAFAQTNARRPASKWALWRAIFSAHHREVKLSAFWGFVEALAFILQPIILRFLLDWLQEDTADNVYGFSYALALSLASLLQAIAHHLLYFQTMRMGWNLRIGFIGLVHQKLLRLSGSTLRGAGNGRVLNLITSDVQRFDQWLPSIHFTWIGPLAVVVVTALLAREVGLRPTFAGVGVVLVSMVIQIYLGKQFFGRRKITAGFTDARVRLTTEVLSSMLTVKAYGWEGPFGEAIARARGLEAASIFRSQTMKALNAALFFSTTPLASLATFSVYWALGNELEIAVILPAVALLQVLRSLVGKGFARSCEFGPECHVAILRLQRFLRLPEIVTRNKASSTASGLATEHALTVANATCEWPASADDEADGHGDGPPDSGGARDFRLQGLSFTLDPGQLLLVTGAVGAGKSSLLEAILGELDVLEGTIQVSGGCLAYAPQKPTIFAGTLRSNVVFGSPFDEPFYWDVIEACCLGQDLVQLPDSDLTEIGAKGVNLSGGQKARVALARAVYCREATVYLLDDILSSVDIHVAKHIYERVICGVLADKAVILATHAVSIVRNHPTATWLHLADGAPQALGPRSLAMVPDPTPDPEGDTTTEPGAEHAKAAAVEEDGALSDESSQDEPPPTPAKKKEVSKLVLAEDRVLGQVRGSTYWDYIRYGGRCLSFTVLALFAAGQILLILADAWLVAWAERSPSRQRDYTNFYVFLGLVAATALTCLARAVLFFYACVRASSRIHNAAQKRVLVAPQHFFSSNPVGRVLNRLAFDQGTIDDLLPTALGNALQLVHIAIGSFVFICIAVPYLLVLLPFLVLYLASVVNFTKKSLRELKRLDGVSRSPVYNKFSASLNGLVPIRAFGKQAQTQAEFVGRLEDNAKAWFWWLLGNRYLGFRLDMLSASIVTFAAFFAAGLRDELDAGLIGLALVYSLSFSGLLQFLSRQVVLVENLMTSVERLLHYCKKIPVEDLQAGDDAALRAKPGWPHSGGIRVNKASVRYRGDLPLVLKDISLEIPGGVKVGLVGRTGSGKSSFAQALFRLNEVCGGSIQIDGLDSGAISLSALRQCMSLVPQDAHLFSETLRYNLDPFREFSDDRIWAALEAVELRGAIPSLSMGVEEQGANFSAGQRQLISLARAMLRNRPIVVMDEATANVDEETDKAIQRALRESPAFAHKTVVIIAHRLQTVLDCGLIVVLDDGHVVECGAPGELLAQPDGVFHGMLAKHKKTL